MDFEETVTVKTPVVRCDGGGGALGHPTVYLHIDDDTGDVICPYCSRRFVLAKGAAVAAGH
jgi:uncharacterized Zn-finger protein